MIKKFSSLAIVLALCFVTFFATVLLAAADDNYSYTVNGGDATEENDGISISKYVTVTTSTSTDEDGEEVVDYDYTLNLEVFTTGVVTTTATETTPADIVLVLDQSTSMMWPADQAEDNGLADGNIGIVDGDYTYEYDDEKDEYVLTWDYAESITVTPLYGVWAAYYGTGDSPSDDELSLSVSRNGSNQSGYTYTVTIDGKQYTWGQEYEFTEAEYTEYWTGDYADEYIAVFGYLYSESRQSDLIEAVVDFISALDTTAGHRVSIVTYNGGSEVVYDLDGEANSANEDGSYDYTEIVNTILGWVTTQNTADDTADGYASGSNPSNLTESSSTDGGAYTFNLEHYTQICYGVESAEEILFDAKYTGTTTQSGLEDLYNGTGRTQLAVIFTDGIPTTVDTDSTATSNVNYALEASYNMKQDGVTVFTIAMLDGVYSDLTGSDADPDKDADPSNSTSTYYADDSSTSGSDRPGSTTTTTSYLEEGNSFISAFLDLLSSNYINADEYIADSFPSSSNLYSVDNQDSDYAITETYSKNTTTDDDGNEVYTEYYYPIDTSTTSSEDIADTLAGIFEVVAGMMEGSATFELDQTTQIRDVMTAEYIIPVEFSSAVDGNGDYSYDENSGTYYYVESGGAFNISSDVTLYISYSGGANDLSAEDYSDDPYDSGYYIWSEPIEIYNSASGSTGEINDNASIIVRNVYIDVSRDSNGDYINDQYVYYYDNVVANEDDTYYLISNSEYTDSTGASVYVGSYIDHDGNLTEDPITLYPTQQVIVSGFNFNNYYVTTTDKSLDNSGDYGAKLIIEFNVETNSVSVGDGETSTGGATIGGNVIETNTTASGVYLYNNDDPTSGDMGYTVLEQFPVPEADIALDVELVAEDQTVYLGNAVSLVDLVEIDGHSIQGVANAYVDITYTLYETVELSQEEYDALTDEEKELIFVKEYTVTNEVDGTTTTTTTTTTKYFTYLYDNNGNKIADYSVTIDAGQSAYDAITGEYNVDTLIVPDEDADYIVEITVTPVVDGSVVEVTYYDIFSVYVLYPSIETNDIWVDYATPVDLRDDNVIQTVDEDGNLYTFDSTRVSWATTSSYEWDIPEPNNSIPPTVIFGYTARRGIEYTAAEFETYGVREDKEFTITSMTTTSSDGYNNVIYYDLTSSEHTDSEYYETGSFEVNVNRFDLEISKTVEADTYDIYPQSFIFNISYMGSEFVTTQKYIEDPDGNVVFSASSGAAVDLQLYVDTSGYYDEETTFAIYDRDHEDITLEFFTLDTETGEFSMNTSGNYIDWSEEGDGTYQIVYEGNTYSATLLYDDDGDPVYQVAYINEVEKSIEVVVDPQMSTVETIEWYGADGTRYYTFNVTVTELYCGIEMTVTEDTEWSWRYTPGFTTTTTTQYAEYDSSLETLLYVDSSYAWVNEATDDNGDVRTTVNYYETTDGTYVVANIVSINDDADTEVRSIIVLLKDDFDLSGLSTEALDALAGQFVDIDAVLESEDYKDINVISDTVAVMSVDSDGDITQVITEEISSYKVLDFDEIHDDSGSTLGTYVGSADLEGVDYAYYLTDFTFNSVSTVTTSADGLSTVILVSNSDSYLDKNGSNTDYSSWERITEVAYSGPNVYTAESVSFVSEGDLQYITYTSTNPDSEYSETLMVIDLTNGKIYKGSTYNEEAEAEVWNNVTYEGDIYYYADDGTMVVGELLLDDDGELAEVTYYQLRSTPMLDTDGNQVVDTDGNTVYEYFEGYAFIVYEIAKSVPAVYFESISVELDVFNTLDYEYWLSYSALIENFFNTLDDPRVEEVA